MTTIISALEVRERLAGVLKPLLIHVLPSEHFAARHLEEAVNVCSYETAFVPTVQQLAPDFAQTIILYGEGEPSIDSADAAAKLAAVGYKDILDFRGGLRAWEEAGMPIVSEGRLPEPPLLDGLYGVDCQSSLIRWTGRNLFNHHEGILKFASGTLLLQQGILIQGELIIDMNSIVCSDLAESGMNAALISHLHSVDFFDVARHPTAKVVISKAIPFPGTHLGVPNYEISSTLTLRGVKRPVIFPAVIAVADADHVTAQAQVEFDRTKFGSHYGSARFFAYLGQHVVNDLIQLHLKIHAIRSK